ncbi:hypothetical protein, partial [Budvicia aquatica]
PQLSAVCLVLSMGLALGPAIAAQTNPPVPIHGHAPTATGTVSIRMPDGTTALVDNAQVLGTKKPNEFTLAPLSSGVTFTDADGDVKATPGLEIAPSGVTWAWKGPTGIALTATQLSQTFATNFAHNDTLTVQVNAPVLSTSLTGIPTTSGIPVVFSTSIYRVKVNIPRKPVIRVNEHTFAWDSGFPTMGFVGAKFQLYMNGIDATANSNYAYRENGNQMWVDIAADGTVSFIGVPTSANKTLKIIATNKTDGRDVHTLNISLGRWFVNDGVITRTAVNADAYCAGLGGGYGTPSMANMTNATELGAGGVRHPTSDLWGQWGDMGKNGADWISGYYWTGTQQAITVRKLVHMRSGYHTSDTNDKEYHTVCAVGI